MKLLHACAAATLIAGFAAASAEAQQRLRDGEGGVVFSYTQPDFGNWRPLASFTFAEIDPETGELVERGETRTHTPQAKDWPLTRTRLEAGSYVLRDIYLYAGASSSYCFAPQTIRFDIAPGEVVYLGHLSFEPAAGPPGGLANAVLGNNGEWTGRLIVEPGDRAAAEAGLPDLFRDVASLSEAGPETASFTAEGRSRREVGRNCANAEPYSAD
ncbi:MAG: hypothetical protein ACFE0P_02630 [Oceanicaulis sp.]